MAVSEYVYLKCNPPWPFPAENYGVTVVIPVEFGQREEISIYLLAFWEKYTWENTFE